jgi:hypothetical protein
MAQRAAVPANANFVLRLRRREYGESDPVYLATQYLVNQYLVNQYLVNDDYGGGRHFIRYLESLSKPGKRGP